jgi:FeS assembly SUF system protein
MNANQPPSPPPAPPGAESAPKSAFVQAVEAEVVNMLKTCFDPEIPVNIYELGLVYDIRVESQTEDTAAVVVKMTLTSPMCPVAGSLPGEVQHKVGSVPGVTSAQVDLVWDPPWNPNLMTEAAKLQLGFL